MVELTTVGCSLRPPTHPYIHTCSTTTKKIFFVRYDGNRQASLSPHTDSGSITFSALLSHGFEGGGTRYWIRRGLETLGPPFAHILPGVGMMQTFPATIQHEGIQTTKGRRYLMIGFLDVDRVDPWTRRATGLSWFASWGSLNWAAVKIKTGKEVLWKNLNAGVKSWGAHSNRIRQLLQTVQNVLFLLPDYAYSHRLAVLVNGTNAEAYLQALDEAHLQSTAQGEFGRASWFAGQQIVVDVDGTFVENWSSRERAKDKFDEM
jgi:hypothetical protein